ncbi:uncharacterized protein LOC143195739 [Rhynchophorus ferrugineus]|uniref:uncharacterized protein LOC143195739 n=1 Tax=Rhynchophorus ferrugineus TaxID=354439 RepID=UPI003FCDC3F8
MYPICNTTKVINRQTLFEPFGYFDNLSRCVICHYLLFENAENNRYSGSQIDCAFNRLFRKGTRLSRPLWLVNSVRERVAAWLNITVSTVNNIAYKMKNNKLDSPKKTRLHTKWVTNLTKYTKCMRTRKLLESV